MYYRRALIVGGAWESYIKNGLQPRLWYRFNDTGSVAKNDGTLGSAADGSLVGGPTVNQAGLIDRAYLFDGVNDFVSSPEQFATLPITFVMLFNPVVHSVTQIIRSNQFIFLGANTNTVRLVNGAGGSGFTASNGAVAAGEWVMIAGEIATGTMALWRNGAPLVARTAVTNAGLLPSTRIGGSTTFYNAYIDEFLMFTRVLTDAEHLHLAQLARLA